MEKIEDYIKKHQANEEKATDLQRYVQLLEEKHGIKKDSQIYNKANISRQNWHSILSGESQPKLTTILKIVFAMKLDNRECKYLLKKVGYTLASSSKFALVIRYCLDNKIYELYEVNDYLEQCGCEERIA